jgi:hypothetical protein
MISWFIVFSSRADRHRQQIRKSLTRSALPCWSKAQCPAAIGRARNISLLGRL